MTTARSSQIVLDVTPYYHCMSRCVRRAFLCGYDPHTGQDFEHRKVWIIERLTLLADVFAIDVCAYAIMSNHLHLVLHVNQDILNAWTDEDIRTRVSKVFRRVLKNYDSWDCDAKAAAIETWRERLGNLSWFMASLSGYIARRANKEDGCKGRFWEARFGSNALLDDGALLTCMAYVDLNPIRAGLSSSLEDSSWTSIKQRISELTAKSYKVRGRNQDVSGTISSTTEDFPELSAQPKLACFYGQHRAELQGPTSHQVIPMDILDYIKLVEWTGRQIRKDKNGAISQPPCKLLNALGLNSDTWMNSVLQFGQFSILVGSPTRMQNEAIHFQRQWVRGKCHAKRMYRQAA